MKYQVQENCLTIYLPSEVDHHNAEEMRKNADALIERNHIKFVIFDFEMTDFMDSSGIGVIMGRYKIIRLRRSLGGTRQCENKKDPDDVGNDKNNADI